jgi:hypothetical protein
MPLVVHGGARVEDLVGVPEPEVEDVVRVAIRTAA